jgi:micrococcal nuclease
VPAKRSVTLFFAVLLALAGCQAPAQAPIQQPTATDQPTPTDQPAATDQPAPTDQRTPAADFAPTGPTQEARVVRVVDGDTIRVELDGEEYRLRYIGMDTPETVRPGTPVEWMGPEATEANRRLVEGRSVVLEKDVSETDRFGRLLRHVWVREGDGWLLVGLELLRQGYAQVTTYPPDVKYVELFLEAQREAREAGRGLWGDPPE